SLTLCSIMSRHGSHHLLHSFPTRRSSDLFENIRRIGISIFASAGIAGIILGLAAQKVFGSMLAGLQIAFTQPIRMDDVVIVEGRSEEHTSELQSRENLVCRLLLEKKKRNK